MRLHLQRLQPQKHLLRNLPLQASKNNVALTPIVYKNPKSAG